MHGSSARWGIASVPSGLNAKLSQEDMISFGFSVRHWQMIEAENIFTVTTLLRVCETFDVPLDKLAAGLGHHLRSRKGE
jgi:hypothetical protein